METPEASGASEARRPAPIADKPNGIVRTPAPQVNRGQADRGNNSNGSGWRSFGGATPSAPAVTGGGRNNQRTAPAHPQFSAKPRRTRAADPQFPAKPAGGARAADPQFSAERSGQRPRRSAVIRRAERGSSAAAAQLSAEPAGSARAQRSYPQQEQRQFRQSAPQQPVRVSPPIVRERGPAPSRSEAPRSSGGGGGGNRGGGGGGGNRGSGGGPGRPALTDFSFFFPQEGPVVHRIKPPGHFFADHVARPRLLESGLLWPKRTLRMSLRCDAPSVTRTNPKLPIS